MVQGGRRELKVRQRTFRMVGMIRIKVWRLWEMQKMTKHIQTALYSNYTSLWGSNPCTATY